MRYYCNICKETITSSEYRYSIEHFNKALCRDHQKEYPNKTEKKMNTHTKRIQDMLKRSHQSEIKKDTVELKSIKDWIDADFETWDKVLNKKAHESLLINANKANRFVETENKTKRASHTSDSVLSTEKMREYSRKAKKKDKSEIKRRGKIGGGR